MPRTVNVHAPCTVHLHIIFLSHFLFRKQQRGKLQFKKNGSAHFTFNSYPLYALLLIIYLNIKNTSSSFLVEMDSDRSTSSNSTDLLFVSNSNTYDQENNTFTDTLLDIDDTDTILSVYWKSGMLGAASYNNNLSEIQVLYDVVERNSDFKILKALFLQIKPTYVVACNLQDGNFLKVVKQLAHFGKINENSSPINTVITDDRNSTEKVHLLPQKYFKFITCEQLILSMPLASAPKDEEAHKRYVRSLVDFTRELAVCALGALIYFIDTPTVKLNFQANNTIIMSLRILNIDDLVWIDISTYESLQIFCAREHPSVYKWNKNSIKEGYSIFSLLNKCNSGLGSKCLKTILAQPTKNLDVLAYRHEVIEFCLQPSNNNTVVSLINCIKQCRCVLSTVVKIKGSNASVHQWKLLFQTVINAVTIGEICERYSQQIIFFKKIKETLKDSLYAMANSMSNIIDFEQSTKQDRFVVKIGFVPELDEKKSKVDNIFQVLDEIGLQELEELPPYITKCTIVKIPEIGFLLCVPFWKSADEMTENVYQIQNLKFKFRSKSDVYYKTSKCYELDHLFGETESLIIQEEVKIMMKLSEYITQHWIGDLNEMLKLIAELDCLIGFADNAKNLNLTKPKIFPKEYNIINIVNGRHILQEKYVHKFVPNSYNSSKISQRVKIITGFNSSGKSIYLKQIALISYLCHIGCYVPAEYAEISVLDHIHTRIQSTESISTLMSAFMVDLRQMSVALNESTCRSLVVLDEFGKGTSEIDGLALLLASISHFVHRPLEFLPHVIVSTHFHSLPNLLQQIINKDILYRNIKCLTMSHVIENSKILCLYKVVERIENQNMSMAHQVAALNGLPTCIVERANQVLQSIQHDECVKPMTGNLRYQLFFRRKQFIEKVLELKGEITNSTFKDLLDNLEKIRYP